MPVFICRQLLEESNSKTTPSSEPLLGNGLFDIDAYIESKQAERKAAEAARANSFFNKAKNKLKRAKDAIKSLGSSSPRQSI